MRLTALRNTTAGVVSEVFSQDIGLIERGYSLGAIVDKQTNLNAPTLDGDSTPAYSAVSQDSSDCPRDTLDPLLLAECSE